jgi:ParB-like chromosome segregation protein Spo0J
VTTDTLQIEHVAIDVLRPDPANPRRISEAELEALTRSLREFGFVDPVIARREDGTVVGGHQRLLAARKLGLKTVPVVYVDLTLEQARLLNLALNKISGAWDEELLARMLSDLKCVEEIDLELSGFSEDELDKLLRKLDHRERRERVESFDLEAALEEAKANATAKRGDLWQLGPHRLLCGDATEAGDVARLLDGKRAAMAFTDPPYGVDYAGGPPGLGKRRKLKNDSLSKEQWQTFSASWAGHLLDNIDGAVYVCMSTREWPSVSLALEEAGGHWSDSLVWVKDRFTLGQRDYQTQYEPIWYGWRQGVKRHWCGDRDQGNVLRFTRPSSSP